MAKLDNSRKGWSDKDIEFLSSRWGTCTIQKLSTMLKRTPNAVLRKASRLKLGGCYGGDDRLTCGELVKVIAPKGCYATVINRLIANGLPITEIKLRKRVMRVVRLDAFWKWAEKHKELIDWSRFEINALGKEPSWVNQRRKIDFTNYTRTKVKEWTKQDEEQLRYLVTTGKPMNVVAQKLGRSETSIRRRCWDLYLPYPSSGSPKLWSTEEIAKAELMKSEGYSLTVIARELGRSESSVYGKLNDIRRAKEVV